MAKFNLFDDGEIPAKVLAAMAAPPRPMVPMADLLGIKVVRPKTPTEQALEGVTLPEHVSEHDVRRIMEGPLDTGSMRSLWADEQAKPLADRGRRFTIQSKARQVGQQRAAYKQALDRLKPRVATIAPYASVGLVKVPVDPDEG